jgi:hypothetical protein
MVDISVTYSKEKGYSLNEEKLKKFIDKVNASKKMKEHLSMISELRKFHSDHSPKNPKLDDVKLVEVKPPVARPVSPPPSAQQQPPPSGASKDQKAQSPGGTKRSRSIVGGSLAILANPRASLRVSSSSHDKLDYLNLNLNEVN